MVRVITQNYFGLLARYRGCSFTFERAEVLNVPKYVYFSHPPTARPIPTHPSHPAGVVTLHTSVTLLHIVTALTEVQYPVGFLVVVLVVQLVLWPNSMHIEPR